MPDELFPEDAPAALGYPHHLRRGMKGYNGVAILSRLPMAPDDGAPDWCRRATAGTCGSAGRAGRPDRAARLLRAGRRRRPGPGAEPEIRPQAGLRGRGDAAGSPPRRPRRCVLVGDLNIAPLEHDVWSHKQLLGVVSHTPVGGRAHAGLAGDRVRRRDAPLRAGGREALHLVVVSQPGLARSNRGRRLDHVWVTPDLVPASAGLVVLKEARDWQQPSDHVPGGDRPRPVERIRRRRRPRGRGGSRRPR